MAEIILLGIVSFIATNLDDMIINTFFFSFVEKKRKVYFIILGKYLGIGVLIFLSIAGAFGLGFLPIQYLSLLGLVPLFLGIKELISISQKNCEEEQKISFKQDKHLLWSVTLITMANGADNIGVYIPLFTGLESSEYTIVFIVFAGMTAIWCILGYKLSKIPLLNSKIMKYKEVIVPAVYILLGIYILFKR